MYHCCCFFSMKCYLSGVGVRDLLVETDVQVVAILVGHKHADGETGRAVVRARQSVQQNTFHYGVS
jgi:hypothetical protein